MSSPPVAGWWTCRECGDWNSPYIAPERCGGCNGDRHGDSSQEADSAPTFSYFSNAPPQPTPKVKFGESSERRRATGTASGQSIHRNIPDGTAATKRKAVLIHDVSALDPVVTPKSKPNEAFKASFPTELSSRQSTGSDSTKQSTGSYGTVSSSSKTVPLHVTPETEVTGSPDPQQNLFAAPNGVVQDSKIQSEAPEEGSRPSKFKTWLLKNTTDAYSHTASPSINVPQKPGALLPSITLSNDGKRASQQRTRSLSFQYGQDESEHGYVRPVNAIAPSDPPPSPANVELETTISSQPPSNSHGPLTRVEADTLRESQYSRTTGPSSIAKPFGDDNPEFADSLVRAEGPKLGASALNFPKDSTDENGARPNGPASFHSRNDITSLSRSSSVLSLADSTFSSIISGSSQSSIGASLAHTEQFSKIVFEDDILQPTCFAIVGVIPLDQFERKLRKYLRSLSANLLQEAKNTRERQAGKFVKLRSRNAAHLICDELNATRKLFKEKQNAAPRAWEQSSDSDLTEDEDDTADIQDLRSFILHSNAFENLRSELLLLLTQQLNVPLPFPDLDSETLFHEVYQEKLSRKPHSQVSSWSLLSMKRRWYRRPKLEHGFKRVYWKCSCGSSITEVYQELEPGAAKAFQRQLQKLQRSHKMQRGMAAERIRAVIRYFASLPATIAAFVSTASLRHGTPTNSELPSFETRPQSENSSIPVSSIAQQKLFILLCINTSIGSSRTGLKQSTVHDNDSDRQLFSLLREEYFGSRHKWWSFLSLWSLRNIFFVHFELYGEEHVDIRERHVIPSSNHEYLHEKCTLMPPIGSKTLMHYLKCPASASKKSPFFNKIPKKMANPLTACPEKGISPGWGLEFAEGWNTKKIWFLTYASFLAGCMLALFLCRWKKYSVQDSVAISTLVFTIYAGGVAVFQASKNMT